MSSCSSRPLPAGARTTPPASRLEAASAWLQRKHGLTIDRLLFADVVTADGQFVKASPTPADAEGVIAVGATDSRGDSIPDYSSRGPTADGRHRALSGAGRQR